MDIMNTIYPFSRITSKNMEASF